jgi:hypothetical protein
MSKHLVIPQKNMYSFANYTLNWEGKEEICHDFLSIEAKRKKNLHKLVSRYSTTTKK